MELYGRATARNGSKSDQQSGWVPVGPETGLEESMRRLGLWSKEVYPVRSGVPDCTFFIRTGSCGYGAKCRYNHPRDSGSFGAMQLGGGEYPERVGEPTCQYYLRTGTCKFGASCKFHHPRDLGGSLNNIPINIYGYPLRPGEKECSYYLKTGQCKFGITCKFHHPQQAGISAPAPAPARPFYPTVQSVPASPEEFNSASTSFRVARPPLLPGSYMPGAYGPVLLHPGVVTFQNWSPYSGQISPALSPGAQPSAGVASIYGISQLASSTASFAGPYSPLRSPAGPSSSTQKEKRFPERPGQPICQYYVKTGDCKFGPSCRYHHPPDWIASNTNCAFSPLGLPLRLGVEACSFYLQKGFCKFGRACKFDHPMGTVRYSSSASSLPDIPIAPYMLGSSLALAPISLPELQPGSVSGSKMDTSLPKVASSLNNSSSTVGIMLSQPGPSSLSHIQGQIGEVHQ